jgi:diguanylate cyclase (GGDEF)-like protein
MGPPARASRRPGAPLLLAATIASLIVTIVGGYLTRLSLVETSWWVTHTDEVKLAINDCEFSLLRNDREALRRDEDRVKRLTVDNLRQQENVARAEVLTDPGALEALFKTMHAEEDRLMIERSERIAFARTTSSMAFLLGSVFTLVFGVASFVVQRAQRQDTARQKGLLEAIIESVDEGIVAVETSRNAVAMNAVARRMMGRSFPRDHLPEDWRAHIRSTYEDGSDMAPHDGPLARAVRGETIEGLVYRIVPANQEGEPARPGVWVSTSARPIRDDSGRIVAAVATLRDITEQRARAERLQDMALTDELTGLLNRRGFLTLAGSRMSTARSTRAPLALLYADLNGLKQINDELGHEHGDGAIKDAANALRSVFREGDIVARIGGDEFVALLPNFLPAAHDLLLERFAAAIRVHVERGQRPYRLSVSAGVTFMDWEKWHDLDDLLAEADRRMYEMKRGRAGHSLPVVSVVGGKAG